MKSVIVENIGGIRQLTAHYNPEFKSVCFEENTVLTDGRSFNVSRMSLRKEDVQAMLGFFDQLEN